jgi:hypothetical protein
MRIFNERPEIGAISITTGFKSLSEKPDFRARVFIIAQ